MPRGWEDFWGRVRRVQFPTVIDVAQEETPYRSDSVWYTHREQEGDLEFNIPTPYLQVRVTWTIRAHAKVGDGMNVSADGRGRVLWDGVEKAIGPTVVAVLYTPFSACAVANGTQDAKFAVYLGAKYMRGTIKFQYQIRTGWPTIIEGQITGDACMAEVGPWRW